MLFSFLKTHNPLLPINNTKPGLYTLAAKQSLSTIHFRIANVNISSPYDLLCNRLLARPRDMVKKSLQAARAETLVAD